MALVNVWAYAIDVPSHVCGDARLRDHHQRHNWLGVPTSPEVIYRDRTWGQSGWDVGVQFDSLAQLASRLAGMELPAHVAGGASRRIRGPEINKLAILAHGAPNRVALAGEAHPAGYLTVDSLSRHEYDLRRIASVTGMGSMIYFMGCNVAGGGSFELLVRLSAGVWFGRYIVAFQALGYAHAGGMTRPRWLRESQELCTEPGMRDTGSIGDSGQRSDGSHPEWNHLSRLPWASHESPSAVVALCGRIVRAPGMSDAAHAPP